MSPLFTPVDEIPQKPTRKNKAILLLEAFLASPHDRVLITMDDDPDYHGFVGVREHMYAVIYQEIKKRELPVRLYQRNFQLYLERLSE